MQELEPLSQEQDGRTQVLEQVSQAGPVDGIPNAQLVQVLEEDIQWMDMESFANAAGKTQQGISYLINKGKLKEYREQGIRIKKTDKWYLDAALVELVKAEKPLKTVEEKEALNNQLRNTQTALVKYREFEKRIDALEDDKLKLEQQVEGLQTSTAEKIQALQDEKNKLAKVVQELSQALQETTTQKLQDLQTEKDNLSQVVQQLAEDLEKIKTKPWWRIW